MPVESQGLQEFVPRLDGEVAAMTVGPKQGVVVWAKEERHHAEC